MYTVLDPGIESMSGMYTLYYYLALYVYIRDSPCIIIIIESRSIDFAPHLRQEAIKRRSG